MARAASLAAGAGGMESFPWVAETPTGKGCVASWGRAPRGPRLGADVADHSPTQDGPGAEGKKAATQARILGAARSLFAQRGYERTTIAAYN